MENLLLQLLKRWEKAFDEMDRLTDYKAQVATTQFAEGFRFNLETFNHESFPAGGPMSTNKNETGHDASHEYGFNVEGLPCFVSFQHDHNKIMWEGYYFYSDTVVEYIEYCLNTGIPSVVKRLEYIGGRKNSYQSIVINGRGSMYHDTQFSKKEIINQIESDEHALMYTVTLYHYGSTGKIEKSTSLHNMPGTGKFTSHDEYSYDKHQNLDTIRTIYEGGSNRLTFCRVPDDMSAASLIENVAEALAQSVFETLVKEDVEQPVAILELNYHYADNYIPLLVYKSAREVKEQPDTNLFDFINEYHNGLHADKLSFERQFAQLEQMMDEKDDMSLGTIMLRKAAYLLTRNKLFGGVTTTDDFVAYAVDWSCEGHSDEHLEEILIECGVEAAVIEDWKQQGILPRT